ncbi:MAG: serine/threonine protein kinase [Pontiellaceae bacterium]|nr:serine/threonine protein kinase [Pontiellaceae bacterium]MBN2783215.1 serine/threonine protein kinase [Pontiellaceae bacterium]
MSGESDPKKKRSRQADRIYFASLEIEDPQKQLEYIDSSCAGNPELKAEVNRLLGLEQPAEQFFMDRNPTRFTASEIATTFANDPELIPGSGAGFPDDDEVGKEIGNYRLLRKIGEGGVGNIYLAEQTRPVRRQVALKIIKSGMDTKSVIARFEAERQALAMMEHPNISRVLNAGETDSGRPFFAMELVHGEKITTYCDKNKIGIRHRLELFIQICHAIQHAHQKGIIHRDIKPSNVLIASRNGKPSPVVIDFGIAKATEENMLTDKTVNTMMGPLIGTPAYMSPEQTNLVQIEIDTRSDIYSMGALLYELLTGVPPFDQKELMQSGIDEMCRILRERDPLRPSVRVKNFAAAELGKQAAFRSTDPEKLASLLAGELDWIIIKTLEKDRERRYETVSALAVDIEHFLNDEPVLACPPSRIYRLRKLVRRNKLTFAYLIALVLALIAGLGTSSILLIKERQVRKRAILAEHQQTRLRIAAEDRERIAHAAFLIGREQMKEADNLVESITSELTPSLETEEVLRELGEWHVLQGRWAQAAERFDLLLKVDIMDNSWAITEDLLKAGPILIERGDYLGYEKFREAAIARYKGTEDPVFAERTLKISLLLPADQHIMEELQPFADLAAGTIQEPVTNIMQAWRCISLALSAYRNEDYPSAELWCERSRSLRAFNPARNATSRVIQAMAYDRQGNKELARTTLEPGRKMIDEHIANNFDMGDGSYGFWFDWLFARILLREADTLINGL